MAILKKNSFSIHQIVTFARIDIKNRLIFRFIIQKRTKNIEGFKRFKHNKIIGPRPLGEDKRQVRPPLDPLATADHHKL